jgi:hypothetical protein
MDKDNLRMRPKKEDKEKAIPIDPSPLINWLLRWLLELTLKEVLKRVLKDAFHSVRRFASSIIRRFQSGKIEEYGYDLHWPPVTNAVDYIAVFRYIPPVSSCDISIVPHTVFMHTIVPNTHLDHGESRPSLLAAHD